MCQEARDREGRSDAMSGLGIACHGSSGELFGLARTQGRKLVSSGKMARVQSEPRSRASCRQLKPLQLVSTQSDLLLGLGDLRHLRRESPGVSPCALPQWEAVTFSKRVGVFGTGRPLLYCAGRTGAVGLAFPLTVLSSDPAWHILRTNRTH